MGTIQQAPEVPQSWFSDRDIPNGKSPLLHAIHILANDPAICEQKVQEAIARVPKPRISGRTDLGVSPPVAATALALGFAGTALLVAASKFITENRPGLRERFQEKWSRLELAVAGVCGASLEQAKRAQRWVVDHKGIIIRVGQHAVSALVIALILKSVHQCTTKERSTLKGSPTVRKRRARALASPSKLCIGAATCAAVVGGVLFQTLTDACAGSSQPCLTPCAAGTSTTATQPCAYAQNQNSEQPAESAACLA
jgi:hypothetical protein